MLRPGGFLGYQFSSSRGKLNFATRLGSEAVWTR
jgi:hypothetical protein